MRAKSLAADLKIIAKYCGNEHADINKEEVETCLEFCISEGLTPSEKELDSLSCFYYVDETKKFILSL